MATSLGQLLDALAETAQSTERTAGARADAGTALGQLGRALTQLRRDGVSPAPGDHREQQVAALAVACSELAARAPATESTLAQLAAAAADSLAVLHGHTTVATRWAAATAVAETVTPLAEMMAGALPAGPAGQWLTEVERQAVLVQQTAALQPPSRADAAILDRPLSGPPVLTSSGPEVLVPDAVAVLLRVTGNGAEPPSVAEVLAYTLAAETLSDAAQRLHPQTEAVAGPPAARAWRAVRTALRPYDDGSRRPHPGAPPAVAAALRVHAALNRTGSESSSRSDPLRAVVAAAAQHLPTLATQLMYRTVRSWADTGALVAYARDVPPREERVAAYLRGYRPGGLVRVDAVDLQPVAGALHGARLLSLAVATRAASAGVPSTADFPRRALAANQALLDRPQTTAELEAATREAGRHQQLAHGRAPGPGRAR
ncbi:hypothetical protein GCU67_13480 [Modestobacter muralis]|uniref:Uncharacterized protein n=1 Tax=Modestobacter muralis TaxID=1608614 RepID=A0A6P0EZB3_9ACTN|nr:hypothetical protein [Modestobacter muralis]NEK95174.1 hypothetical protein [Modestobacter muralis]NEN52062.1 hypothetical protein [Modestobacter muralis]